MALETSAERKLAIDGLDQSVINFVKRSRVIGNEANGYVAAITQAVADATAAKAMSDVLLAADPSNAVLAGENAGLAAKITEGGVVLVQAQAIATAINDLV
ncbi:hypothetical protein N9878_01215 [bacterium]|nr:hypothetical protein [bacterium]